MASVSSTSSLGNTSLRGFGGMVSGIDRDEIIEQMTLGTTTKINNAQKDITRLEWKQEAYRSISDKIIGMSDDYFTFSSPSSLIDSSVFAKSLVTVHGSDKSSKYVTASGTSDLVGNVSISAVKQLATSTVLRSDSLVGGSLKTELSDLDEIRMETSSLEGSFIRFGYYDEEKGWSNEVKFAFNSSYTVKDADGKSVTNKIDYILPENATDEDYEKLAASLNDMLAQSDAKFTEDKFLKDSIQFAYQDGKLQIVEKSPGSMGNYTVNVTGSSALKGLGFTKQDGDKSLKLDQFNSQLAADNVAGAITRTSALDGLKGKEVTFNYNGSQKKIEMITKDEWERINAEPDPARKLEIMQKGLQERLDRAYGKGNVEVKIENGSLAFKTSDETSSVSIVSGDDSVLRCMGISYGASSRINLNGTLAQNADKLGAFTDEELAGGITINGVKIGGITKDTSISSILSKINSSKAGVKATYVEASGQFMLVSSETGANRTIDLGNDKLTQALFGYTEGKDNSGIVKGQDAIIEVSYGNGVKMDLNRASNTFNLEGLSVTVSGLFGGEWEEKTVTKEDGTTVTENVWKSDSSDTVTFTAKADVDKATERVKGLFEAFNALVEEINTQITTRPDSSYGPLTDEQKDEMNETSIENWEKKAKQGILYSDSSIRDLSSDIQGIFVKLMNDGARYQDLEKIGITYSSDYKDGGKIIFDEAKFRSAMESDPELVSDIFTGGGNVGQGLTRILEKTFTPYATRYASDNASTTGGRGSYGRLIEEAGSEKAPTTLFNNFIYNQIKEIQDRITTFRSQLKTQQDRYIKQFSTMETLISQMNSQSSWLSQITG